LKAYMHIRDNEFSYCMMNYSGCRHNVPDVIKYLHCQRYTRPYMNFSGCQCLHDIKLILFPLKKIHIMYYLTNLRENEKCEGCSRDACGQMAHMECPSGCLHDKSTCFSCSVPMKSNIVQDSPPPSLLKTDCQNSQPTNSQPSSAHFKECNKFLPPTNTPPSIPEPISGEKRKRV